ncbi:hypothetical protein [Caulobacter sp. DWR3-1-2]|uniref:hypothetical protein n=1 Tax=Caulobacter sp. DWR3-1-2 TaxID=2804647 RepID=UPI003CE7BDB1
MVDPAPARLRSRLRHIPVRIVESNGPFDFRADGVDLAIRMRLPEAPPSPDADVTPFLKHYVGPVVSPALAAQAPDLASLAALPACTPAAFSKAGRNGKPRRA